MLVIKPLNSYKVPKYPQKWYYEKPPVISDKLVAGGLVTVLMLGLLTSCGKSVGVVGPPPSPPRMVTENEARTIINQVFEKNGIEIITDAPLTFGSGNMTTNLILDGYNEEFNIGYEYISGDDGVTFTERVRSETDDLIERLVENPSEANGPFIKVIGPSTITTNLEEMVEEFIDFLRNNGAL